MNFPLVIFCLISTNCSCFLIKCRPAKVTLLIVKEILLTVANIFILEDEGNISILAKQAKDLGKSIEYDFYLLS